MFQCGVSAVFWRLSLLRFVGHPGSLRGQVSDNLRNQRPLGELRLGLLYEACDERLEIGFANPSSAEDAPDGGADLGADLIAMRLGPVHLEVALDGLNDVVDQVAKERLVVHAVGILGDSVVEGDLLLREAELTRAGVAR